MSRLGRTRGLLLLLFASETPEEIAEEHEYFAEVLDHKEYGNTEVVYVIGHDCKERIIDKREGLLGRVKGRNQIRQEIAEALGTGNNTAYIEFFNFANDNGTKLTRLASLKVESPLFAYIRESLTQSPVDPAVS